MKTLSGDNRNYGIDLLKTLSMFFVVILHVLGHGGVLKSVEPFSTQYFTAYFLRIFAYCAVNCFALATGYLMVGRPFKYRKIVPLWLTVFFYTIIFLVLGFVLPIGDVGLTKLFYIFPVISGEYWYFTAYFAMFLFVPFLNFLVENLSKKKFYILLLTGFILFCLPVFCFWGNDSFKLNEGYSVWWLAYLYLLGAGVKKYDIFKSITAKKSVGIFLCMVFITLFVMSVLTYGIKNAPNEFLKVLIDNIGPKKLKTYFSPTILISAIALMIFCLKVSIPKTIRKFTKWVSPMIFQVYIIHENFFVKENFIVGRFKSFASLSAPVMVLAVLGTSVAIFAACILIDWFRVKLFKLLKVNEIVNKVSDKISEKVSNKLEKYKV